MEKINLLTLQDEEPPPLETAWFAFYSTVCDNHYPDLMYGNMCLIDTANISNCQHRWKQQIC